MKKYVKGKVYDTATAAKIGDCSYGSRSDFDHVSETLYQKKSGEFFIYGEGGPLSRYAVAVSYSEASGGEAIAPLTYEEAQTWAEKHLTPEEYDKCFGEISDDATTKTISITLSASAHESGKRYVQQNGGSLSALINDFLAGLQ